MSNARKTIYLIRHGESDENKEPVFQGEDSSLNAVGVEQVKLLAARLKDMGIDALVSSTFSRALQTTKIVSEELDTPFTVTDLFVEKIKPASIRHKPYSDEAASATWHKWEEDFWFNQPVEEAETYQTHVARARAALDFLDKYQEKKIAVISHGYFIRTVVAVAQFGDSLTPEILKRYQATAKSNNTGITILEMRDEFEEDFAWRLRSYNDFSHLQ